MINKKNTIDLTSKYLDHLHHCGSPVTHLYARENRQESTEAEKKLWSLLRDRRFYGKKFRRQHAIANYILDFYCHECKLAIELDGNSHPATLTKENDRSRTALLNKLGITVLRFWNADVINDPLKVLHRISSHLN